jgi:hypothetical protein
MTVKIKHIIQNNDEILCNVHENIDKIDAAVLLSVVATVVVVVVAAVVILSPTSNKRSRLSYSSSIIVFVYYPIVDRMSILPALARPTLFVPFAVSRLGYGE